MNLSNKLTLSRIIVIPFFLISILPQSFRLSESLNPYFRTLALLLFIGASITDYYDGLLARKHGWITNFGKLLDPVADKVMVMTAFVCLVDLGIFPAWMVVLILAREFIITGLRSLAATQGRVLSADRWGKNKTISQIIVIITGLTYLAAQDILTATGHWTPLVEQKWGIAQWLRLILQVMMLFTVALTVLSGWLYFRKNWDIVNSDL